MAFEKRATLVTFFLILPKLTIGTSKSFIRDQALSTEGHSHPISQVTNLQSEITSLKTSVSNGKSAVASAITDKGVSTSATASFTTMASNIRGINTGHSSGLGKYIFSRAQHRYLGEIFSIPAYGTSAAYDLISGIPADAVVIVRLSVHDYGGASANGQSASFVSVSLVMPPFGNWATYGDKFEVKMLLLKSRSSTWRRVSKAIQTRNVWYEVKLDTDGILQYRVNNGNNAVENVYTTRADCVVMVPITSEIDSKLVVY